MNATTKPQPPLAGLCGSVPPAPGWFTEALAAPCEHFSVEVDGVRLDCRAWGERGNPGLVFVHGSAAHLGWWSFLAPFFSSDHRVVTWSLSGMGKSDWRDQYSIEAYTEELWAVAQAGGACEAGPPVLIGHSLGGHLVHSSAAFHPEQMRAGVLVDCSFPGAISRRPQGTGRSYPNEVAALERFLLSPEQPCENLFIIDFLARMSLTRHDDGTCTFGFDRGVWSRMILPDLWEILGRTRAPMAVVRGDRSWLTGGEMKARMRATLPQGTPFIEIPEAYHHVQADQPLALVAALRSLLEAWA